jgi:type II secretory pathway component GspD/PulD (secretin)
VDKVKTNLMVFIRPKILRDGTEAAIATNSKYNYARDLLNQDGRKVPQMFGEDRPSIPPLETYEEEAKAIDSADDSGE